MTLDYISRKPTTLNSFNLMDDRLCMITQNCLDRHSYYTKYRRYIYIVRGTYSYSIRTDRPSLRSHEYVLEVCLSNISTIQDTLYTRSKHE